MLFLHLILSLRMFNLKTSLVKRARDCDETNQQKVSECIEKFMQSKLGCRLPWMAILVNTTKVCESFIELRTYFNYNMKILQKKMDQELKEFGCLKPNCEEVVMSVDNFISFSPKMLENNPQMKSMLTPNRSTIFVSQFSEEVIINSNAQKYCRNYLCLNFQVFVTEEFELFGVDSFFADTGGFLGLLLGASLLSFFDSFIECIYVYFEKRSVYK